MSLSRVILLAIARTLLPITTALVFLDFTVITAPTGYVTVSEKAQGYTCTFERFTSKSYALKVVRIIIIILYVFNVFIDRRDHTAIL